MGEAQKKKILGTTMVCGPQKSIISDNINIYIQYI